MILYFDTGATRHEVAKVHSVKEALQEISIFLKNRKYVSPYTRLYINPDNRKELVFDFGCHTQFFFLEKEDEWESVL